MADGYIVYQGMANESQAYFEKNLIEKVHSKYSNPADIFMKELALNYPKTEVDEYKINNFVTTY